MNVYIIGVGPGNGRYLIKESEEKIENADIIIGASHIVIKKHLQQLRLTI